MTTVKPLPGGKPDAPIYYDEIVQVYDIVKATHKGEHDATKALAELEKQVQKKKAVKAKLVAGPDAFTLKKKGMGKAPSLDKVPYEAVKAFYQFSNSPAFLVIGVEGKAIPKQYIILAAPTVEKVNKLATILQTAQWAPKNNLKNEVPPVKITSLALAESASNSSSSPPPMPTPAYRRSLTPSSSASLRNQPVQAPRSTPRKASSVSRTSSPSSPRRQPVSRTSTTMPSVSRPRAAPLNPPSMSATRSRALSSSSSSSRTKATPMPFSVSSSPRPPASRPLSASAPSNEVKDGDTLTQFLGFKPVKQRHSNKKRLERHKSLKSREVHHRSGDRYRDKSGTKAHPRRSRSQLPSGGVYLLTRRGSSSGSSISDSDAAYEVAVPRRYKVTSRSKSGRARSSSSSSSSTSSGPGPRGKGDRKSDGVKIYRMIVN